MLRCRKKRYQKTAMPPPLIDERKQDSHRAKVRIGVAAALLVTAIGILTVLNQRRPEQALDAPETEQAAEQESISSEDMETSSAMPDESPTAAPLQLSTVAVTEPPPPPMPGTLPKTATSPGSKPAGDPGLGEESAGVKFSTPYVASAGQTLGKPAMSAAAVQSPAQAPALQNRPVSLQPKAFEVQLGVFTDIDNAKQLQARLAQHGIPSHTETRVQIGPFKSRDEADRAREKLKALGVSAVILGK